MTIVSPSLLAADFLHLDSDIEMINRSEAEWLHLDVMDGAFVPNISFGQVVVKSLRKHCRTVFDVHLMINEPIRYIGDFVAAGADYITVHYEACADVEATLKAIRAAGKKAGISVKPKTEDGQEFRH